MELAIRITQLILSMSLLIILHELGHFFPAKWFKTRVEKFYLFFNPGFSLYKKKIGETIYGIGWLPLGGYVKIAGMVDESMDKEGMAGPPQPWEFRSKPAWQRLIIMVGGVTVNLLVGFIIFIGINAYWGKDVLPADKMQDKVYVSEKMYPFGFRAGDLPVAVNGKALDNPLDINRYLLLRNVKTVTVKNTDGSVREVQVPGDIGMYIWKNGIREQAFSLVVPSTKVDSVIAGMPAAKAGLQKGDEITAIDGKKMTSFNQINETLAFSPSSEVSISFLREGVPHTEKIALTEDHKMGIAPYLGDVSLVNAVVHKDLSFGESIREGVSDAYWLVNDFIVQFKYVFTKKGATQMGGFGTIAKLFPQTWDWHQFWLSTGLISIMLAIMNLLPIPALDGGHIVFLLFEWITGIKPSEKFLEYAQILGIVLLFSLMIYANGLDIWRALTN